MFLESFDVAEDHPNCTAELASTDHLEHANRHEPLLIVSTSSAPSDQTLSHRLRTGWSRGVLTGEADLGTTALGSNPVDDSSAHDPHPCCGRTATVTEEPPIDIHHYTWAIRRALPRILVLALLAGVVAVLSTSLYTSKSYSASTTILAGNTLTPNQSPDATTLARSLATVNLLTGTTDVLALAASKLPNTTVDALRSAVQSTVNPEANVITVKATADTPEAAAARANAVAPALIATERRIEQRATADKLRAALREVRRLRSAGATRTEVQAAENRISSLAANAVGSAAAFRSSRQRSRPASPLRHHRDSAESWRLSPSSSLECSSYSLASRSLPESPRRRIWTQVFSAPVLTSIRLFRRVKPNTLSLLPQSLRDDFYTLASGLRQNAVKHDARIIFVVSAIGGEGRTTVTANLSQALSMSGASVLAVCADLRSPKLHEWVQCPQSPGLTNIVAASGRDGKAHEANLC